jgi:hypothetical protein
VSGEALPDHLPWNRSVDVEVAQLILSAFSIEDLCQGCRMRNRKAQEAGPPCSCQICPRCTLHAQTACGRYAEVAQTSEWSSTRNEGASFGRIAAMPPGGMYAMQWNWWSGGEVLADKSCVLLRLGWLWMQ